MLHKLHRLVANSECNPAVVKQFLEQHPDQLNVPHKEHNITPVEYAAKSGNLATLRYLIEEAGADIDASSRDKNLLYWAKDNPFPEVLDYLTDPKNGIIAKFNDGTTDLHAAVIKGDAQKVKELLSTAPELLAAVTNRNKTALFIAASLGRNSLVHIITTHPAFMSLQNEHKYDCLLDGQANYYYLTGIHFYSINKHIDAIESLNESSRNYQLISNKTNDDHYNLGIVYLALARAYDKSYPNHSQTSVRESRINESIAAYIKAIDCLTVVSDKNDGVYNPLIDCHESIAVLFSAINQNDKAKLHFEQARNFCANLSEPNKEKLDDLDEVLAQSKKQEKIEIEAKKWGFSCHNVPGDGACFFHAAIDQLNKNTHHSNKLDASILRIKTVHHIEENLDSYKDFMQQPINEYLRLATQTNSWADNLMLQAFSRLFNVSLVVIHDDGSEPIIFKRANPLTTLYFGYQVAFHYQALYPIPGATPVLSIQDKIERTAVDEWQDNAFKRAPYDEVDSNQSKKQHSDSGTEREDFVMVIEPQSDNQMGFFVHKKKKSSDVHLDNNSQSLYQ